jgi:Aspartyl protease
MRKNLALGLLLACGVTCTTAVAKTLTCQPLTKLTSIELQIDNAVWVPVSLHGSRAWMQLNTGAPVTVIYESAAKAFGLPIKAAARNIPSVAFGALRLNRLAVVDSLQLGTVRLREGTDFLLVPESGPPHRHGGDPILGLLAMDVFAHVDVELDLAHRALNLFSQDYCPRSAVYWSDTAAAVPMYRGVYGALYFPMELDGKVIEAGISTTTRDTFLHTDVSEQVFHFDEHSPGNEAENHSGEQQVYYRAMKLTASGLKITNARIRLIAPRTDCKVKSFWYLHDAIGYDRCIDVYPLDIGISVLEKLHLYFATGKHVLYFTATDSSEQSASVARPTETAPSMSAPRAAAVPPAAPK